MKVQLKNYVLVSLPYPQQGTALYDALKVDFAAGNRIDIDMTDVTALPSMFLNASFGRAIEQYGLENIRKLLVFHNITRLQSERLSEYFNRFNRGN